MGVDIVQEPEIREVRAICAVVWPRCCVDNEEDGGAGTVVLV